MVKVLDAFILKRPLYLHADKYLNLFTRARSILSNRCSKAWYYTKGKYVIGKCEKYEHQVEHGARPSNCRDLPSCLTLRMAEV